MVSFSVQGGGTVDVTNDYSKMTGTEMGSPGKNAYTAQWLRGRLVLEPGRQQERKKQDISQKN